MLKLAKYMKDSIGVIFVIFCLLVLQAYCDLELPNYTSKIVNTGIQQGGIEDPVPEKIRQESLDHIALFLSKEENNTLLSFYETEEDPSVLSLKKVTKEERTELSNLLSLPEMVLVMLDSMQDPDNTFSSMFSGDSNDNALMGNYMESLPEGTTPLEAFSKIPALIRKGIITKIKESVSALPETIVGQSAIQFVKTEYQAIGENTDARQNHYLLSVGLRMLLLALIAMCSTILVTFLSSRLAAKVSFRLRNDVYKKVIGFGSQEFNRFSSASLITRSTNDIQQIQMFLALGFRIILYGPILGIGGVFKVTQTDVSMSWIIALAVGLILLLIIFLFTVAMPRFTILQTLIDNLNLVSRESLTGVMVTRAFSAEAHEEERFDKANLTLTKTNLFVNRCMTFMMPCMMIIMNGVSILIVYNGSIAVDKGTMQVGDMMAFITYSMQIIMAFLMVSVMSIMIPRANVAAKRINEVLETQVALHAPAQPKTIDSANCGTIDFDHVTFTYPDAEYPVLKDITFHVNKGETVAFIGSTGSGKSTLVNLIPRFFDVTEGSISVDGVDVRDLSKKDLCSRLGFVPQKSTLFSGTIDSNLRFGAADASKEEIQLAAAIAQAADFIETRDGSYDAPIAQGGGNVSGGQKQRLSIARAIAKKPEILIFDDSFSALDFKTDTALRKALKEHTKDTTTLIVAQRISTILHADRIIVLDNGEAVGIGTHKELMKSCTVYRQIAMSQLSEEELIG